MFGRWIHRLGVISAFALAAGLPAWALVSASPASTTAAADKTPGPAAAATPSSVSTTSSTTPTTRSTTTSAAPTTTTPPPAPVMSGPKASASQFASAQAAPAVPADFVQRSGQGLVLDGRPWAFVGVNIYNANSRDSCWYTMAGTDGLQQAVTTTGATAIRAWFFQPLTITPGYGTPGAIDWSVFDDTLARARTAGVKVVATLTDQWGACEPGGPKTPAWYAGEYRTTKAVGWPKAGDQLPLTYRDFVAAIVTRYRDNPTILSWQPVNEPENCGPNGTADLYAFTKDITGLIKSLDPNHLVSLGTIGSGQCGTVGPAFQTLHALPTVDWVEVHDYYGPSGTTLPGDQWNGMAVRFNQAAALNKPLVVGEAGIKMPDVAGGTPEVQATLFAEKIDTYRSHGAAGFLAWSWVDAAHDSPGGWYNISPGRPVSGVIAARAATWMSGQ